MIFNFELGGKEYSIDLFPEQRVAIARHLIDLHKKYCAANPDENIDFEAYLSLVEASPHPENIPQSDSDEEDEEGEYIDEQLTLSALKRLRFLNSPKFELQRRSQSASTDSI